MCVCVCVCACVRACVRARVVHDSLVFDRAVLIELCVCFARSVINESTLVFYEQESNYQ